MIKTVKTSKHHLGQRKGRENFHTIHEDFVKFQIYLSFFWKNDQKVPSGFKYHCLRTLRCYSEGKLQKNMSLEEQKQRFFKGTWPFGYVVWTSVYHQKFTHFCLQMKRQKNTTLQSTLYVWSKCWITFSIWKDWIYTQAIRVSQGTQFSEKPKVSVCLLGCHTSKLAKILTLCLMYELSPWRN